MSEVSIDYQKLMKLCEIDGLKNNRNPKTSSQAHEQFMKEYANVFIKKSQVKNVPTFMRCTEPEDKLTQVSEPSHALTNQATGYKTSSHHEKSHRTTTKEYEEKFTHDIRDYMALLHKQRISEDKDVMKREGLKTLRRLLRKLPFERTTEDNESLFRVLKQMPDISDQMEDHVLKEMCMAIQMDVWKDPDITVFGNLAFYIVLHGSVHPLVKTYLLKVNDRKEHISSPRQKEVQDMKTTRLHPGDCFGTLIRLPDRPVNSRVLSVTTAEPSCELLKITTSDYFRVTEQIKNRDRTEKINLLQSSGNYKYWTRQPLQKVAKLFVWVKYPENTVIVTEGTHAKFIGFIKSGECHVIRQVTTIHRLKNGRKEKRVKQVVMGKLSRTQSFGEDSVLGDVSMSFSIVTATECTMAIIDPTRLIELDDVTRQLLRQSSSNAFSDLKEDEIHNEFIEQELKREWNDFKHGVVMEVISDKGVKPGYGKWAK